MSLQAHWQDRLSEAIRFFWKTRQSQADRQGARTGTRDCWKSHGCDRGQAT